MPLVTPVLALGEAGPVAHELLVPALAAVLAPVAQAVGPAPAGGAGGAGGAARLAGYTGQEQGGQQPHHLEGQEPHHLEQSVAGLMWLSIGQACSSPHSTVLPFILHGLF